MGRILVIHPHQGFLDMVRRILANRFEVEAFNLYQLAADHLTVGATYEAVLCSLAEPAWAIKIFEKAAACSADILLIPIASDLAQLDAFKEQWNSDDGRKQKYGTIGQVWLRERCTTGDLFALFTRRAQEPAADFGAAPNEQGAEGEQSVESPGALGSGTILDGYRLVCSIGQGGFGAIWMCVNTTTEKRMAIKLIEGEEQVSQELVALRKYVHVAEGNDHLIQVEHINSDATRLWLVTPLADSLTGGYTPDSYKPRSLANLLPSVGHLPEPEAIQVVIRVGRALLALHHAGLLHGDVAPGNILCVHGRWVLADPGLVRFLGEQGICRNRRFYPDLKASRPYDDLYALGLVLWEMVSGIAEMVSDRDRMRLDGRMVGFLSRTDLPMAKLLYHAAAQNPEWRYMNAEEMLHDLESVAAALKYQSNAQNSLYHLPTLRSLRTSGAPPPLGGAL